MMLGDLFFIISFFLGNNDVGCKIRSLILKVLGCHISNKTRVLSGFKYISGIHNLSIAENCFLNINSFFDLSSQISISRDTLIGPNVSFITSSHSLSEFERGHRKHLNLGNIEIKDSVFIGANCVILGGVTIGKCAVIGANSLVASSVPDYSLAVGSPAKVIKKLNPHVEDGV